MATYVSMYFVAGGGAETRVERGGARALDAASREEARAPSTPRLPGERRRAQENNIIMIAGLYYDEVLGAPA